MLSCRKKKSVMRIVDMTQGNPLKLILQFAIPMFIGNIFQQVYTMADTMVVGHNLGEPAIAAIGATSALYGLMINFAFGMNSGYGIVVTRCFGAHNQKELKEAIAGMIMLNAIVALVLTVFSLMVMRSLLVFLNTPDAIFEQAYIYIVVICGGMVTTIAYNMIAAILRAVGNSRSPLYFLIVSSLLNIVLDILFVTVVHMGIAGAAVATVIAELVSAVLCGCYLIRNYRSILPKKEDFHVSRTLLLDLLSSGFAMALMLCVVDFGSMIFQRANNALGEAVITAHTASRRIMGIMMQPLATIATANSTFIGQNWGAGKIKRIRVALKKVVCLEVLWAIFACIVIFLSGAVLVRFTTGTSDVGIVENAVMSLRFHLAFFPVLAILLCLRTSMQAMGYKAAPVISSCIELVMKVFAAWWLIPELGFLGTSITEPITWTLMMMFLAGAYWKLRRAHFWLQTVYEPN